MSKNTFELRGASYELEIHIDAPRERAWKALTRETNLWWLPDFHVTGPGSVVELRAEAGGQLIERRESGESLLWYTVNWVSPGESLQLVGHSLPDWGGPGISMLVLNLVDRDGGCTLKVSDSLVGRASDEHAQSLRDGWTQLFGEGLKKFVETGAI